MPIHEIRESIELEEVSGFDSPKIIERVINLKTGFSHTLEGLDVFLDNPFTNVTGAGSPGLMEIVLTSRPMLLTNNTYRGATFTNATPSVSNDYILAKKQYEPFQGKWRANVLDDMFPNDILGSKPTFTWYTPKIYMYVVLYSSDADFTFQDIRVSVYAAVKSKKVSYLSLVLGNIREFSQAQIGKLTSNGRVIPKARVTGQYFPMYLFGGIRPQYMASSQTLSNFYLGLNPQAADPMLTTTAQRSFMKRARTMVNFDEAFGGVSPSVGAVPDWFSAIALEGVVAGAVRDQWPPLKHDDNGNVRML